MRIYIYIYIYIGIFLVFSSGWKKKGKKNGKKKKLVQGPIWATAQLYCDLVFLAKNCIAREGL